MDASGLTPLSLNHFSTLFFWDSVSHWPWSCWKGYSDFPASSCPCLSCTGVRGMSSHWQQTKQLLRVWTQACMLVEQALRNRAQPHITHPCLSSDGRTSGEIEAETGIHGLSFDFGWFCFLPLCYLSSTGLWQGTTHSTVPIYTNKIKTQLELLVGAKTWFWNFIKKIYLQTYKI